LIPKLTDIVFVVVFILVLASGSQMLGIDSDLGRHLTLGNYILEQHTVPTRDIFSHTLPNHHRPPYEWLAQIFFALVNRLLGLDGVILFTATVIAITFTLAFQYASQRSQSPIIALVVTLLSIGASSLHWLPRPHIITFLLLGIWVEHLEKIRIGKPVKLIIFSMIMLFWVNMHGGFIFGILAWCAYFAGWLWDKYRGKATNQTGGQLLVAGITSLVVTVITPDLWRNWEAVLNNRSAFILSRTVETMPPNLLSSSALPFTFLLVLTVSLFALNYKTLSASHFLLLAGFGAMSLLMARNIPLFVIIGIPIISMLIKASFINSKTWGNIEERFAGFGKQAQWSIIPTLAIFLAGFYFVKQQQTIFQFNPQVFPVQAMDWLDANPQSGNMFNEFNWGGYILYQTWPKQKVFLDSQSDFYGEALMRDYEQIISARGDWESQLEKYKIDWLIIPVNSSLGIRLSENQNWETTYKDGTSVIIRRAR